MSLDKYRQEIDSIDSQLLELIEKRMRVAEKVAEYKKAKGLPVADYIRERELLDKIGERSSEDLLGYNRILFNSIMDMSKDHQRKTAQQESQVVRDIHRSLSDTPAVFPETPLVACQGVVGAYSQEACDKFFKIPRIMYTKNFRGVFSAIDSGLCKYGVLPLENSTAGSVNQVYDLMMEYNFHIVRSLKMQINHCLLAKPGVRKEEIKEILSHPQALSQCEEYLKGLPGVTITECENTAEAAKMVSQSHRRDIAAIGSVNNGKFYGLDCLATGIQDRGNNYTRFICISKDLEIYPGANKTSIMMILDHKPGSLYNVLARFNAMGINLEKLESRPLPSRDFEFMFYFDIEESVYSEEFIRMMNQLEEISIEFRYLGSYSQV